MTIKISGHPPFAAQVMLNGHEYVAAAARAAGIGFRKEGNCFTQVSDPERLAQIADTFSQPGGVGRLSQVIDRWIYSACLCCGLGIDEQEQSGFRYDHSIYQVEYSRNLVFASGAVMDRLFNTMVDRTALGSRSRRSARCSAAKAARTAPEASSHPDKRSRSRNLGGT